MEEYLDKHFIIKFLFLLIVGIGTVVISYLLSKSFKKESLLSTPNNNLKRMTYWRTLGGMLIGSVRVLISFYLLFEDLTKNKEEKNNKFEQVQIK
ncbi:hypothetical protein [Chryseobacterium sp. LAM-KRS1]|uniref:hypothetical protein n=1 Tax=Chryseobacterium sp. LAM-KRS1 TaxID=2715754 RepID=UPI0015522D23|nr:hypothetical protein [Chryseobacterium sp. LAM-KRS1]